jgi:hypothetical protein
MYTTGADIVAYCLAGHDEMVDQSMEADPESEVCFVCEWFDIDVFPVFIAPYQFYREFDEPFDAVGEGDLQYFARVQKTLIVFPHAEKVHLLVTFVPVAPDALETPRSVSKPVCLHGDSALFQGYEPVVHKQRLSRHMISPVSTQILTFTPFLTWYENDFIYLLHLPNSDSPQTSELIGYPQDPPSSFAGLCVQGSGIRGSALFHQVI